MKKNRVIIIAEAGVNHNGSLELALQLIDAAANAGADVVKFQTFKAENLATNEAPKAQYQKVTTNQLESQQEMLQKYELDLDTHKKLLKHCQQKGIEFLSSPFDLESLILLTNDLGLDKIKIPSGEITNAPLLLKTAQLNKDIILSTGMSTLTEVKDALAVLTFGFINKKDPDSLEMCCKSFCEEKERSVLKNKVFLLHCTSEYPAPYDEVNLRAMDLLRDTFGLPVGLSDHTQGIAVPIAAVARGALIVEKHFTLDKNLPGPDHKASLEPNELTEMVRGIRQIEIAMGDREKTPTSGELKNCAVVRKCVVASTDIKKGDVYSIHNIGLKRAGKGISGMQYWELFGRIAARDYKQNEIIKNQ
jgi:N-acetylneuraminate synthase